MKILCKLQIDFESDRLNVVTRLANAGYTIAIELGCGI